MQNLLLVHAVFSLFFFLYDIRFFSLQRYKE